MRTLWAVPDCLATTRALCSARVWPGFHRLPQAVRSSRSGGHADACCRLLLASSSVRGAREHHTARLRALLFDRQPVGLCVRVSSWDWRGLGVDVLASLLGALYAGPDRVVANRTSTTANVAVTIESSPTIFHVLYWLRRTGRPLARRRCQALGHCIRASLGTRPRWVALLAWGLPALLLAPGGVPVFSGATVWARGHVIAVCLRGGRPCVYLSYGLRRLAHHPIGGCSSQNTRASQSHLGEAVRLIWYVLSAQCTCHCCDRVYHCKLAVVDCWSAPKLACSSVASFSACATLFCHLQPFFSSHSTMHAFKCSACNRSFSRRCHMAWHMQRNHATTGSASGSAAVTSAVTPPLVTPLPSSQALPGSPAGTPDFASSSCPPVSFTATAMRDEADYDAAVDRQMAELSRTATLAPTAERPARRRRTGIESGQESSPSRRYATLSAELRASFEALKDWKRSRPIVEQPKRSRPGLFNSYRLRAVLRFVLTCGAGAGLTEAEQEDLYDLLDIWDGTKPGMPTDAGHHRKLRDVFKSSNAFKTAVRDDVDEALLEVGWRKITLEQNGDVFEAYFRPVLDVVMRMIAESGSVQLWSGGDRPAPPSTKREYPMDGDDFRLNEADVVRKHGPGIFVLGLHVYSDATQVSRSGGMLSLVPVPSPCYLPSGNCLKGSFCNTRPPPVPPVGLLRVANCLRFRSTLFSGHSLRTVSSPCARCQCYH